MAPLLMLRDWRWEEDEPRHTFPCMDLRLSIDREKRRKCKLVSHTLPSGYIILMG